METRTANVVVNDDQVALAVGKSGQNVRLASLLTGFNIILSKTGDEDIELVEFKTEFGDALYDEVVALGIETAREFLEVEPETLLTLKNITKEKLIELRLIILVEFDETESKDYVDKIKSFEN